MRLIRTGFFREMPFAEPADPSIKDFVNFANTQKEQICAYLLSGIPVVICPSVEVDIINPDLISGTGSFLTDGKWTWPECLAYYVKKYDIRIDDDFLATMEENNWTIPISEKDIIDNEVFIDGHRV